MANGIGIGHRERHAFYRLPPAAQAVFRMRVMEARCEDPRALAVFGDVRVADLLRPVVELYDVVVALLGRLTADELAPIDVYLFGATSPHRGAQALILEVLDRGGADGLDNRQLAGGIQVVLESRGLLPRQAA